MTAKNFVNIHILISHSPSSLNRDDMNMQKTAIFGGKSRVRISSQSLKRALRFSDYYQANLGEASVRTRDLGLLKARMIAALGGRYDADLVGKALELLAGKEGIADGSEADAVAPWSADEVAHICEMLKTGDADEKKLRKEIEKNAQPFRAAMAKAVDIALSGRMATSGLLSALPVDGALAVAHAITTHAVEPQDVDWFTAVDDLTQDAGETGAGHLNTQQFSAGVFYRYASLNLRQLQVNLGLLPDIRSPETTESRTRALGVARHVLHLLATVVPAAKQQPFAAYNLCDLALVSFSDVPVSLANAFEAPVQADRNGGFLAASMAALTKYWATTHAFHGLDERGALAAMGDVDCPAGLVRVNALADLEGWLEQGGQI
jgi:CRISPR system Cascade subunit CasC